MNDDRSLERAARSWIEQGPTQAPDRPVDAALTEIQSIQQDRALPILWRLPNMTGTSRLVAGLATIVVVVAAAAFLVGPNSGTGGVPSPSPSPSPAPTLAAIESPSPSVAACGLLTPAEVVSAFGNPALGANPAGTGSGAVTTCRYNTGGLDLVASITYTTTGGQAAFQAVQQKAGVQVVTDVGADAVFDPASSTLYVAKGDALVAIFANDACTCASAAASQAPDALLMIETQLGKLIANRI
jgi:hypothetical protein